MVGCPRRHLVLFLARCGTTIRSQSLLLRQFPLSLREDALDWYFNLPSRSISSWDVLANQFYRAFYASGAIHIDMREWEEKMKLSKTMTFSKGSPIRYWNWPLTKEKWAVSDRCTYTLQRYTTVRSLRGIHYQGSSNTEALVIRGNT